MSALEELKKNWKQASCTGHAPLPLDEMAFNKLVRSRIKKQNTVIFRHFWATFTLHLLVYALLSHVGIKYWADNNTLLLSITGILLTVPYTVVLVRRYSQLAASQTKGAGNASIRTYVDRQQRLLSGFFLFKKRYEMALIPLHSAIGVIITFHLFVPGGVSDSPEVALTLFLLTLLSCFAAVRSENRKSFVEPLHELQAILNEYTE